MSSSLNRGKEIEKAHRFSSVRFFVLLRNYFATLPSMPSKNNKRKFFGLTLE